jgi:putative oxidoreductase
VTIRVGAPAGLGPARAAHLPAAAFDWLVACAAFLAPLFLRVALAIPFFRSGLTKWDGLSLSPGALYLFENEFRLHILGSAYEFPLPVTAALLSAIAEIVLPALLVVGLGTRFAAGGILLMTMIIQLVIPDAWLAYHLPWAAMALALIALGPGPLSLDRVVARLAAR